MRVRFCTLLSVVLAGSCAAPKASSDKPQAAAQLVPQTPEPGTDKPAEAALNAVLVVVDFPSLPKAKAQELVRMLADGQLPNASIVFVSPAFRAQHPSRKAPYLVHASYFEMGTTFRISASLVSIESGIVVGSATAQGKVAELEDGMSAFAAEVESALAADISS